jgi:hypothetical protein
VLAGTTGLLAVALILLALAVGIISILSHPTVASLRAGAMALWICAMAATVVGAFVGGWLAGYLPGSTRRGIGVIHGFLAWALAVVVSLSFQLFIVRATLAAATNAAIDAAVALDAAPAGPDEANAGNGMPGARPDQVRGDATAAGRTALAYVAGLGWSWFGTWFLAGAFAMAGASAGVRRLHRKDFPDEPLYERQYPNETLTPHYSRTGP